MLDQPRLTILRTKSWSSFSATTAETTAGRFVGRPHSDTSLLFHLGPPAKVRCEYDGTARSRVQSRGCFDIIPAGCPAAWDDEDPTSTISIWLSRRLLDEAADGMAGTVVRNELVPSMSEADERLFGAALMLEEELEPTRSESLFAECVASAMAIRLLERFGLHERLPSGSTLTRKQFRMVTEFLDAHLDQDVTLEVLCNLVGLSASHFRALFRQTVGRPIHKYIVDLRLERAKSLLENSDLSIAEVALESGFCHQSHLANTMRKRLGRTPSEYSRNRRMTASGPLGRTGRYSEDVSDRSRTNLGR